MKIGLVGYQGGGKSTLFELLTRIKPDPAKTHSGQVGVVTIADERLDRLAEIYRPKKITPAKIELFDTPGLSREIHENNPQRLAIIRESAAMVHVIGEFAGGDPLADLESFEADVILTDLQVVENRIKRLRKDLTKPLPDRDLLQAELEALLLIEAKLADGESLLEMEFSQLQQQACQSFSLLTRKKQLVVLNTAEAQTDAGLVEQIEQKGYRVLAAPVGLELELQALSEEEQAEFAAEMGLGEPCRAALLKAIFEVTNQITFYTCNEKEVHARLLRRGATALEAALAIHSDLARGFIRAEIVPVDDLLRFGSERELKVAGLQHIEGKDYVVQDGDEVLVRFSV